MGQHLDQEKEGEKLLSTLESIGVDDADFDGKLRTLRDDVLEHAGSEEENEFPIIEDKVDAETLEKLRSLFRSAESFAPTHPHPHGPTSAAGNAAVGPMVALVDWIRDGLRSNRGRSAER